MLDKIVEKLGKLYENRMININLNVLIAVAPAFAAAGGASELMECFQYSKEATAAVALAADLSVYLPIQAGLHYRANKNQFRRKNGTTDWKLFAKDMGHIYGTMSPMLIGTSIVAPSVQYSLMSQGMEAFNASQVTYWGLTILTRTVHTIIGCATGLFKQKKSLDP